jgi:hypothetical protein
MRALRTSGRFFSLDSSATFSALILLALNLSYRSYPFFVPVFPRFGFEVAQNFSPGFRLRLHNYAGERSADRSFAPRPHHPT